jgi:hypothetical protein
LNYVAGPNRFGAEFRASLNGSREGAAREFEKALRAFTDFIIKHKLPKS